MKKDLEYLSKPLIILVVTFVASLFLILKGYSIVNDKKDALDVSTKLKNQLTQKVNTLSTVDTLLASDTTVLDVILPNKGAVLYGLSQVKSHAATNNILTASLKTGTSIPEKGDVYKTTISFEAEGEESSMYDFLNSFSKTIPLMSIEKVNLNKADTSVRASVTLSVFSADYPKKIPSVTEATKELTNDEIKLLQEVMSYSLPNFIEPGVEVPAVQKQDPFNSVTSE